MSLCSIPRFSLLLMIMGIVFMFSATTADSSGITVNDILLVENPGHFTLTAEGVPIFYIRTLGADLEPPAGNGTLMSANVPSGNEFSISNPLDSVLTLCSLSPGG
jgi:hypothetical protein